jgi:hypothetical protein
MVSDHGRRPAWTTVGFTLGTAYQLLIIILQHFLANLIASDLLA